MALPKVQINLTNGNLGQVAATNDQISGLLMAGIAVATKIALNDPKQLFSLEDAIALGLDAAYDASNTCSVYAQIAEFYAEAPNAELWIQLYDKTAYNKATVLHPTTGKAMLMLDAANGNIKRLGVVGIFTADTTANGLDQTALGALVTGQNLAEAYAANNVPLRIVIEGSNYTGTPADLQDLKTGTANRCAILLSGTTAGGNASVGLLLGRKASNPVQRNIGRVKDGSLSVDTAFFTDGAAVESVAPSVLSAIHDKGYIMLRTYAGKSGYFFSDDPTATAATDDYNTLARGEVIDKAHRIAYTTFLNELLDEVPIDSEGRIAPALTAYWEALIENATNLSMTANGEISAIRAEIDPAQNVLSTNKTVVKLYVTPVGYAKEIEVILGFTNPAN